MTEEPSVSAAFLRVPRLPKENRLTADRLPSFGSDAGDLDLVDDRLLLLVGVAAGAAAGDASSATVGGGTGAEELVGSEGVAAFSASGMPSPAEVDGAALARRERLPHDKLRPNTIVDRSLFYGCSSLLLYWYTYQ